MRRDPRRRRLAVGFVGGLLVLVLVVSIAGGPIGDDGASSGSTTTAPIVTIPIAPEDRPFCEAFGALVSGPLTDPATDPGDPASLGLAAVATLAVLDEMVATAPPELAEPVGVIAEEYRAALAVFEAYGYDLDRVAAEATPEEQAVLDAFGAAGSASDEALAPIETWVADRCATEDLPDLDN